MSTGSQRLRAGIAGLGAMGRNHARVMLALPDVDLVAIYDPSYVGQQHLGVSVVGSLKALIAAELDYCVIATPTVSHLEVASLFADQGIACLIEKPLALTAQDAEALADYFELKNVPAAVGQIERYNPAIQALRSQIATQSLGGVIQVATRRLSPLPSRVADVGVTLDLATHDIDLTRFALGAEYRTAQSLSRSMPGRPHEDALAVLAEMTDGTLVIHQVNWLSPMKERVVTVTGHNGVLVADTVFGDLTFYKNGAAGNTWQELAQFGGITEGEVVRFALKKTEPLRAEHVDFIGLVRGEPHTTCGLRDGATTVHVAERLKSGGFR